MVSQKPKYCKNFERNSHWRKLSMIMVWERYCNASPKPEFFLFSLFIFSFISRLIWVRLGWYFHRWFSIQKQGTDVQLILSFCSFAQANTLTQYLSCILCVYMVEGVHIMNVHVIITIIQRCIVGPFVSWRNLNNVKYALINIL